MIREIGASENPSLPFSSATAFGDLVFVSGQGGLSPETGEIAGQDLESQTVQTLENIRLILAKADLTLQHIVKVNVYLKDRSHYKEFNEVYRRYFRSPYPSRTLVYCDLNYDLLVEIDAIAVVNREEGDERRDDRL
ncbi:RidA family protein [Paenibacillus sp. GXUN7292]|uniref:RidA family protein n=1 Tax=Paenibacillus sp. GXUN7292 TaxID=3422499 RepID=UPI003D7E6610